MIQNSSQKLAHKSNWTKMKHIRFAMDLELVEPDTENLFNPSRKEISLWSNSPLVQFDTHQCFKEERWTARPSEVQTLRVNFKDKIQKIHQNGWKLHREMFSLFNTTWSVQFSLFVFPKVQQKGKRQMTQGYTQPHVIHTASFGRQSSVFISFLIHDLRVRFIAAVPESSKLPLAPETRNLKSAVLLSVNSVLATPLPKNW